MGVAGGRDVGVVELRVVGRVGLVIACVACPDGLGYNGIVGFVGHSADGGAHVGANVVADGSAVGACCGVGACVVGVVVCIVDVGLRCVAIGTGDCAVGAVLSVVLIGSVSGVGNTPLNDFEVSPKREFR